MSSKAQAKQSGAPAANLFNASHPLLVKKVPKAPKNKLSKLETAGTSTASQVTRATLTKTAAVKQCEKKESLRIRSLGHFKEVDEPGGKPGRKFRVTLLQEGMGNMADCFFYTADAIRSAVPIFEGKKFFLDHPTESEEVDHPERSVNDIAGYFENLDASTDADGAMCLVGDLNVLPGPAFDKARALMIESIAYAQKHPDDELVGLSINADGDYDEVPIDQFLKTTPIPPKCQEKLIEAMAKGITMIRPVRQMTSAFSCDLVTVPGAGGKVNQLLEKGKSMEKKEGKSHEEHEEKHKEDGAPGGEGPSQKDVDGGDADHPDAAQDEQLVKKMLDKYLGKPDHSEDDHAMAKEAMKHAMEMGLEGDEAMKCAGYNMKMAKHMQGKQPAESEGEAHHESGEQPEQKAKPKAVGDAGKIHDQHSEAEEKKEGKQKESSKGDGMVKMAGELARLRQELDAMKLKEHVEVSLKESKLPMSATKKFRECIKDVKTSREIDEKLKTFKEAFALGGEAEGKGWVLGVERGTTSEAGTSFADCVETE